jgi:hypothetical protein
MVFPKSTVDTFHTEGDVKIVKANSEHAGYLQHHLRPYDLRECVIHGSTAWRALHQPLRLKGAHTWTVLYKDSPVCMFGVVPIVIDESVSSATVWMLGATQLDEVPVRFVKVAQQVVDWLQTQYDLLENVVPVDHTKTIAWLDHLGFMFAEEPTIVNGFQCLRFVRCEKSIEVTFQ